MKARILLLWLLSLPCWGILSAQGIPVLDTAAWMHNPPTTVLLAPSALKFQLMLVGGYDSVLTHGGMALSKGRNDYVTFVPITPGVADSGYVCIAHETITPDSLVGDGGGMTVIKVVREGDSLRKAGPPRAVDFRHVGGTMGNCAGITSLDGRVWVAEEPWRSNNLTLNSADTADVTLAPLGQQPGAGEIYNDIPGLYSGETIKKFQNFNYMVEVDPASARAVRKQYNWGRMQHEGGAVLADNRTVIITPDAAPCYLVRFVADTPGDFTRGHTYAYKQDPGAQGGWHEIDNGSLDSMMRFQNIAARDGCTMFNRLEWAGEHEGKVYFTETGRDDPQGNFRGAHLLGAQVAHHHIELARVQNAGLAGMPDAQVADSIYFGTWQYHDYYGRVLVYDPATDSVKVYLEGGPLWVPSEPYPEIHLSNPDGLAFFRVNGHRFMILAEDLIGSTMGRIPPGTTTSYCEIYMLDMAIPCPTVDDLVRLAVMPVGAEASGPGATPDGKTLFFCSQHPSANNPFPYNYSITIALSGWDNIIPTVVPQVHDADSLVIWPNPVSRTLHLSCAVSGDLYGSNGQWLQHFHQKRHIECTGLAGGIYFLRLADGRVVRLMVAH